MTADHYQALFDHKYLRWFDLGGQPALCEVIDIQARVEMTLPGGAKARKPVVSLKQVQGKIENATDDNGKPLKSIKPLVLNATNAISIADVYGDHPSAWIGKQIVLFETTTKLWDDKERKMKDAPCIRIRAPRVEGAK